jgi:alkaline phosphatase D
MSESPFRHAVASGDPLADRVVIWTRVSGLHDDADVTWSVARDPELLDVVASGTAVAEAGRDHTVHVDVAGLAPDTRYWYAFELGDERSPVGRTKTLPASGTERIKLAQVSCAKYSAGFFNGYARIAERDDLDFVLHLGDYIYEVSNNPPASQTPAADIGRPYVPENECVTLEDYRARYGHYRLDPDVQALHLAHPVIATVDDHEFSDGVWREGSIEHREDRDGPWPARRAAAFQARWDWQPYRMPDPDQPERVFRSIPLGDLATLFMIDTRSRRDEPLAGSALDDPSRGQLGAEQKAWLFGALEACTTPWRLLGNSSVMAPIWAEGIPPDVEDALVTLEMVNEDATGPDPDQWDGYPYERAEILRALRGAPAGAVVLSGDVHIAMVHELRVDDEPVAGEFVTGSLTSQNVDDKKKWARGTKSVPLQEGYVAAMPTALWCDFDAHGYTVVEVTPRSVICEWWFVDTVLERTSGESRGAAYRVIPGSPRPERLD